MVTVALNTKFTSINFEKIVSEYWENTFSTRAVTFDLSRLEWIANEQMTFLISWIDKLRQAEIIVTINTPGTKDILPSGIIYERRKKCLNYLMADWKLQSLMNERGVQMISGDIQSSRPTKFGVPFYGIRTINYEATNFDSDFDQLYKTSLESLSHYVERKIKSDTFLNYFDNHFLHYSIIKEFFSNTCQHAYEGNGTDKSFFSIFSNNKIDESKFYGELFKEKLDARYLERPTEEQKFFKDATGNFINQSFVEFTFLDFGVGIVNTLKSKYSEEGLEAIKNKLGKDHESQNEETKILEYAFLLFTSRYELGMDLEMHNYIPRGLYIVKDIVKRYGGMVIARSGKGKVIFNFNKFMIAPHIHNVIYRENDFDDKIGDGFPGTSITIVLPARESDKTNIEYGQTKKTGSSAEYKIHFINLLKFTHSVLSDNRITDLPTETKKRARFYQIFFSKICNQLMTFGHEVRNLILFDFAGIELSNHDIYNKFLYFLSYCPLISDNLSICLFNVVKKGINQALAENEDLSTRSKGFFVKPIPCIYPDFSVNWIGIADKNLEAIITSVWKQDERKNKIDADIHHIEGNIVEIYISGRELHADRDLYSVNIKVQSYFELINDIYKHHSNVIEREVNGQGLIFSGLQNEKHDYNIVLKKEFDQKTGNQRVFLTANGKYQKEFLTFIEKLYHREYRRLIATYFLFNFVYDSTGDTIKGLTKVLTVTLSSQLLGKEFADIVNDIGCSDNPVKLIPLSSYYDFSGEEPFNEIKEADQIIVVNDVVSTGNLSREITKSVTLRKATVLGLITIIDSRTEDDMKIEMMAPLITLLSRPIQKFEKNDLSEAERSNPIWINPILNAPNTMSREKSDKQSILKSPTDFIDFFPDDSFFKVGYFKQNTVYHTYYLQTDLFLKEDQKNGFPILTSLIEAFSERLIAEKNSLLELDITEIKRIHFRYLEQYKLTRIESKKYTASKLGKAFELIQQNLVDELTSNRQYILFDSKQNQLVDFIFYPFLSSVSEIEKKLDLIALSLKRNHSIEVYPVPRIMTPRGWRFSFPPKFLNSQTKNKSVLIFDDGSCTGETIIQMIDSLSFLELSEINVLSIFARLEDFQREFLTRIKQVKVKDSSTPHRGYKMIPINIYFGTHFHIPVYTKNTHPFFYELKELEEIKNYYEVIANSTLPKYLDEYIQIRSEQISFHDSPNEELTHGLFPTGINKRLMFIIRDIIGNYDGYRLFKEDEQDYEYPYEGTSRRENFRELIAKPEGKIALMAVLTHEPNLIDTVRRVYPEHIFSAVEFLENDAFNESSLTESLDNIYFILRAMSALCLASFFNRKFMLMILDKIDKLLEDNKEHHSLYFIGYMFSSVILKKRKNVDPQTENDVKLLLQSLFIHVHKNKEFTKKHGRLIGQLYNDLLPDKDDSAEGKEIRLLQRVKNYYLKQIVNFKGNKDSSHPNDYLNLSALIITLQGNFKGFPGKVNKTQFVEDLFKFHDKLSSVLIVDLKKVLDFLEDFYLKNDLTEPNIPSLIKLLDEFDRLSKSIKSDSFIESKLTSENSPRLAEWLLEFQREILELEAPLPSFILNDNVRLKSCVEQTILEFKKIKSKELSGDDLNIRVEIDDTIYIRMHPYLSRIMIFELIENKRKYALKSEGGFRLVKKANCVEFIYWQKHYFKRDIAENGLTTLRNIAKIYGGVPNMDTEGDYYFSIKFPNSILI